MVLSRKPYYIKLSFLLRLLLAVIDSHYFPCFLMTLRVLRSTGRVLQKDALLLKSVWCFSHDLTKVIGFGKKDHRSKVPSALHISSVHAVNMTYHSWWWPWSPGWSIVCRVSPRWRVFWFCFAFAFSTPYSLKRNHYVQPLFLNWLHFIIKAWTFTPITLDIVSVLVSLLWMRKLKFQLYCNGKSWSRILTKWLLMKHKWQGSEVSSLKIKNQKKWSKDRPVVLKALDLRMKIIEDP